MTNGYPAVSEKTYTILSKPEITWVSKIGSESCQERKENISYPQTSSV